MRSRRLKKAEMVTRIFKNSYISAAIKIVSFKLDAAIIKISVPTAKYVTVRSGFSLILTATLLRLCRSNEDKQDDL